LDYFFSPSPTPKPSIIFCDYLFSSHWPPKGLCYFHNLYSFSHSYFISFKYFLDGPSIWQAIRIHWETRDTV
jgi:hypothetical protein